MSFFPPTLPSETERRGWSDVPGDLVGRVVSLDELRNLFPSKNGFTSPEILERKRNYSIYALKPLSPKHWAIKVAYECGGCNKIIVGQPEIRDDTSIDLNIPLAGREGYDTYCKNCNYHLEDITFVVS